MSARNYERRGGYLGMLGFIRPIRTQITADAEFIMQQKLWLPVYEEGGIDALIRAGEIAPPPPPRSDRPNMSGYIR